MTPAMKITANIPRPTAKTPQNIYSNTFNGVIDSCYLADGERGYRFRATSSIRAISRGWCRSIHFRARIALY